MSRFVNSPRLETLEQELFECTSRISAFYHCMKDEDRQRYAEQHSVNLRRQRELSVEISRIAAAEDQARRREPIERVLLPRQRQQVARAFVWSLAQHAIDIALEHRIAVVPTVITEMRAVVRTNTAYCAPALSERAYAGVMHELAHLIEPSADGHQQRYVHGRKSVIAPLAECRAWIWTVVHAYRDRHGVVLWTVDMHNALNAALGTYRADATVQELDAIARTIAFSYTAIQPAPDSPEGRELTAERIAQEWRPSPRLQRRLDRVAAIAQEIPAC